MIIDVLGTGESIAEYNQYKNYCIGVNNIFDYHPVDALVLVDPPEVFIKKQTLDTIVKGTERVVFTNLPDKWVQLLEKHEEIQVLKFHHPRGDISFEDGKIPHSNNSTFVAAALAFKLGASIINLYGVDFNTHPAFGPHDPLRHTKAIGDFKKLHEYAILNGCAMFTTKQSALSKYLPIIES